MSENLSYTIKYGGSEYVFGGKEAAIKTIRVRIGKHSDKSGKDCLNRIGLLQLDVGNSTVSGGTSVGDFQLIEPEETFKDFLVVCTECKTDVSKT